jgi:SAM-dependent methyltransferase
VAERTNPFHNLLRVPAFYEGVQRWFRVDSIQNTFLATVAAKAGDRILDVGSGLSTVLAQLPEGVAYTGFEPNPAYVAEAKTTYGERGSFNVGYFDAAAASAIQPVDVVLIQAVLHHMSDDEAGALFALLARVVKPGGRVVTLDNVFIPRQNPVARLLISLDRGRNVRSPEGYVALVRPHFGAVEGAVHHTAFPPYTYWIMTAAVPR